MRDITAPLTALLVMIFIAVATIFLQIKSYKQGQVDCLNGIIKYQLTEQPDKTMKWERIYDKASK